MKASAYIRVSGKGQIDGDGPDRQRLAIKQFCEKNGLEFCGEFFEAGVSGTVSGMERPAFLEAVDWAVANQGVLIVERLDRLAREVMVQEVIIQDLRKQKVKLFSCDLGLQDVVEDCGDPGRVLMRQIMAVIAEYEKVCLVLKMRGARQRIKLATGRCEGAKPYGMLPGEDKVLKAIIAYRAEGKGYGSVAKELNLWGIKPRKGLSWTKQLVYGILNLEKVAEQRKARAQRKLEWAQTNETRKAPHKL